MICKLSNRWAAGDWKRFETYARLELPDEFYSFPFEILYASSINGSEKLAFNFPFFFLCFARCVGCVCVYRRQFEGEKEWKARLKKYIFILREFTFQFTQALCRGRYSRCVYETFGKSLYCEGGEKKEKRTTGNFHVIPSAQNLRPWPHL